MQDVILLQKVIMAEQDQTLTQIKVVAVAVELAL